MVERVKDTGGFHGAKAQKVELEQIFSGLPKKKKKFSTANSSLKLNYLVHTLTLT